MQTVRACCFEWYMLSWHSWHFHNNSVVSVREFLVSWFSCDIRINHLLFFFLPDTRSHVQVKWITNKIVLAFTKQKLQMVSFVSLWRELHFSDVAPVHDQQVASFSHSYRNIRVSLNIKQIVCYVRSIFIVFAVLHHLLRECLHAFGRSHWCTTNILNLLSWPIRSWPP